MIIAELTDKLCLVCMILGYCSSLDIPRSDAPLVIVNRLMLDEELDQRAELCFTRSGGDGGGYPLLLKGARCETLEALPSWQYTEAHRISRVGDVLGKTTRRVEWKSCSKSSDNMESRCGVLWSYASRAMLLEPLRLPESNAHGWNEKSCIVGSEKDGRYGQMEYPLLWEGNVVRQLQYRPRAMSLAPGFECGTAYAINDSRIAVGSAFNPSRNDRANRVPIAWVNDTPVQLPTPSECGEAFAVTSNHLALGISESRLVLWNLAALAAGGDPRQITCVPLDNLEPQLMRPIRRYGQ